MTRKFCIALVMGIIWLSSAADAQAVFKTPVVEDSALGKLAGREDINQTAQSTSNAVIARNSIGSNSVTGDAHVDGQAFQNLSGLSLVNVNTGNNVAINASMNVNITIFPGR